MSRPISPAYRSLCLAAICILLTISFSACSGSSSSSGGAEQQSGDPGEPGIVMPPGTGGVAFQLVWQKPSVSGAKALFTPAFNACADYALDTITATVSNGTTTVASGSWPCSAHQGLMLGVPAGTNYTVQIDGLSTGPTTTIWRGLASSITVNTGQITNAGNVVMSYIGTDTTQPTVISIGPKSNPTSTTNIPIADRFAITFDEPMAISTITTTNITLKLSDNTPVTGTVSYGAGSTTAVFIPSASLAYGTEYVLQVTSCIASSCITDDAGNLLASNYTTTVTTESAPAGVPGAPSGVTATAGNGQVTLDWLASSGSTSFNVYYLSSAGVTTTTGTLISDVRPPYVHLGRTNGQPYYYLVTAVNSSGETPAAAEVSATPVFPAGAPASLSVAPNTTQNTVSWAAVGGATSYNLYWSTSAIIPDKNSADHVIRSVASPYTHTGLTEGVTYCYIVTANNSSGESADSMQACVGVGSIQLYW